MKKVYIPLRVISATEVLLFQARVYEIMGEAGAYGIQYSVAVRSFEDGFLCDKHEVFQDYQKHYKQKYARKSAKNLADATNILEQGLGEHLQAACAQYGVIDVTLNTCKKFDDLYLEQYKKFYEEETASNPELDEIAAGIIDAVMFTEDYAPDAGFKELAPDTVPKVRAVAKRFCNQLQKFSAMESLIGTGYPWRQLGQDIYFVTYGHGVGFRDRDELKGNDELIDDLETICAKFHFEVELGDDDLVHFRPSYNKIEVII